MTGWRGCWLGCHVVLYQSLIPFCLSDSILTLGWRWQWLRCFPAMMETWTVFTVSRRAWGWGRIAGVLPETMQRARWSSVGQRRCNTLLFVHLILDQTLCQKLRELKTFAKYMCACILDCVKFVWLIKICDYFTTLFFFSFLLIMHAYALVCVCVCVWSYFFRIFIFCTLVW
jgi:hypothetical protein